MKLLVRAGLCLFILRRKKINIKTHEAKNFFAVQATVAIPSGLMKVIKATNQIYGKLSHQQL